MRSAKRGGATSNVELSNVSVHGMWRPRNGHLRWPQLDVDLTLDSIENPDRYPLVSREEPSKVSDDG